MTTEYVRSFFYVPYSAQIVSGVTLSFVLFAALKICVSFVLDLGAKIDGNVPCPSEDIGRSLIRRRVVTICCNYNCMSCVQVAQIKAGLGRLLTRVVRRSYN